MRSIRSVRFALALAAFAAAPLSAQSVYNPATGRYYALTPRPGTLEQVRAAAAALGGSLVSIGDAAEQAFVAAHFASPTESRLIGYSDDLSEGAFAWDDGTPGGYTNWALFEPNDAGGEDAVEFLSDGKWNDIGVLAVRFGIVEGRTLANLATTELFHEDFSDNSAGWTLDTEWQIGAATTHGGVFVGNPDPSTDADGVAGGGVAGVVIGGTASTVMHSYYWLTSPILPAPAEQGLTLSFDRFLNSDYPPYMDSRVEVFDGVNWTAIWASDELYDTAWTTMIFDVLPLANPSFRVRFGFDVGSSGVFTVSSWNVDNVRMSFTTTLPTVGAYAPLGGGTGSLGIAIVAGPQNEVAITAVAIGGGNVPNGWFYGVDILYFDLVLQAFSGAPPFVVALDGQGAARTEILAGVPAGLPLGIVTVPLVGGLPSAATAPVLFVTH
jgi:hypothetical protein